VHRIVALFCAVLFLTSCGHPYSLDCGPLDRTDCEHQATEIVSIVTRDNPGRSVTSIVFVNTSGDARVILDDGTEVGWGERLATSN
jgi:hypothetical protein